MRTTSFKSMECPTARALDCIGESWTLLILRDALQGCTRFDEFQRSVGIATNTLTRRLKRLVDQGLLERRRYMTRPTRYEYVLTQMGIDLFPLLVVLFDWGSKYLVNDGVAVQQIDRESGRVLESVVVDRNDLQPITVDRVLLRAGPVASAAVHERVEQVRELRESASGS
ncbi:transcriptional regulator [Burkholderia cepacia JBK9]|uniref:Helix-turn-helix transcriptional regulator n=1 Tax=Burkholderia arboris TaxID=488730 RepID=A0A9Q9SEN2_9BURK|nr:helix-turn-helix domain-containing protein [Burkholderia arboris]ALX11881.1 transcriptional regulator [Burkholderia cepacia JBK9]MCA8492366.1 helix-turn-helix transcriptional regulator [Burkholderia arboris]UTV53223.1 helix-turn-helix domain-containing protein [Burkholderia arboris]VWB19939.1 HxlR family transcriptional regulator [Burkholderia arboris]